ncbi:MAG: response regulator transcription factor [Angelakisella sp.]
MAIVLLIDDDPGIMDIREIFLLHKDYSVQAGTYGEETQTISKNITKECVVLDVPPLDISCLLSKEQSEEKNNSSVILLSRLGNEENCSGSLKIPHPFSAQELAGRIQERIYAVGRHRNDAKVFGDLTVNKDGGIFIKGRPFDLTAKESALLTCLTDTPNCLITTEALFKRIWKLPSNSDLRVVSVHIAHLRKKLTNALGRNDLIETVWGRGYRFKWVD